MKKIISVVLFLFLLISIPLTVYFIKQQQNISSHAAPTTSLSLDPESITIQPDKTQKINVVVDTGGNLIVSADIVLTFDPKVMQVTDISAGDFLPQATQVQKLLDNANGKITYSIFTYTQNAKSGKGNIAILTVKGNTQGSTNIIFDKSSSILGIGEGKNLLVSTVPGAYTIGSGLAENIINTPSIQPTQTQTTPTTTPIPPTLTLAPTTTLVSSPTPTLQATQVIVTNITSKSTITTDQPTLKGTAAPGAKILITLHSTTPITGTTTADQNGNWSWSSTNALAPGDHNATIVATDNQGNSSSTQVDFTVNSQTQSNPQIAAPGNSWSMIIILGIGVINIFLGLFLLKKISI